MTHRQNITDTEQTRQRETFDSWVFVSQDFCACAEMKKDEVNSLLKSVTKFIVMQNECTTFKDIC